MNSPVRAFRSVGGSPFFVERGDGAYLSDVDGNHYLDYVQSWGASILGHAHPKVVAAVKEAVRFAEESPMPDPAAIYDYMYSNPILYPPTLYAKAH